MDYLFALAGLVLLFLGGESLVRGAVGLARRFEVSPLFSGIVIVGFGTSAPELFVCVEAVLRGQYDIAVGNIVGSNIANVMLILGIAALIQPVISRGAVLRRDGVMMLASSLVLVALAVNGEVPRLAGGVLLAVLLAFIAYSFRGERNNGEGVLESAYVTEVTEMERTPQKLWLGLLISGVGIAALVAGSALLVEGATGIAVAAGISEAVIAVTLVAVGTSLPELATVIVAALRKHADVALGNVLGSNIFNAFGILGVTALVEPVMISAHFLRQDVWVMLGASILLLVFMATKGRVTRWESGILLTGYAGYVMFLFTIQGVA